MNADKERFLTPSEVARRLRVSIPRVQGWIRRGDLGAVDLSDGRRSCFRISPDALDRFLKSRDVQISPARTQRRQAPEGGPLDPVLGAKLAKRGEAKLVSGTYYRVRDGVILFY